MYSFQSFSPKVSSPQSVNFPVSRLALAFFQEIAGPRLVPPPWTDWRGLAPTDHKASPVRGFRKPSENIGSQKMFIFSGKKASILIDFLRIVAMVSDLPRSACEKDLQMIP